MIFHSFISVNDYSFFVQITEKRSSSKTSNDTSGARNLQRVQCLCGKVQVKQKKKVFFFLFCGNYLEIDWRCQKWRNPTMENGLETEEFSSDDLTFCCRNCRHVFSPTNKTSEDICLALSGI